MPLGSQENLADELGLSFKTETCELGAFSICTLHHGSGRGLKCSEGGSQLCR